MKVHTESGSIYEIEPVGQAGYRVRRLLCGAPASDNVRATAQWREALTVSKPAIGQPLVIGWRLRVRGDNGAVVADTLLESTVTSLVTHITMDTH